MNWSVERDVAGLIQYIYVRLGHTSYTRKLRGRIYVTLVRFNNLKQFTLVTNKDRHGIP